MVIRPSATLDLIWIGWLISWVAASFWSSPMQKRVATLETWTYRAVMIAGGILLFARATHMLVVKPLWQMGLPAGYVFVAALVLGLALCWWARIHLGRLWSVAITRKEAHRVVDTGPYALVRHPIYTGLIVGLLATAAADGTAPALTGAAMMIVGLWLKARTEERFLTAELGAEAYSAYRRRVPMLIPFLPPG